MLQHINGGKEQVIPFIHLDEAVNYFINWCNDHGYEYEYPEGSTGEDLSAGGIGHDYRIAIEVTK